jgi:environmental stress-induced protein Ves
MKFVIHPLDTSKTVAWASGTSTELFIHPADGNFQKREFIFRISTATVEAEETNFSDFTGLTRILMILRGKLTLIHEGRYTKELNEFDQDTFDGAWQTRSKGKVQDFNLMFNDTCKGEVNHYKIILDEQKEFIKTTERLFLFVYDGIFQLENTIAKSGDLIEVLETDVISMKCLEAGNVIGCKLQVVGGRW